MTSKGQITLPLEIRQRLGLKQGDQVVFITENGMTVVKPFRADALTTSATFAPWLSRTSASLSLLTFRDYFLGLVRLFGHRYPS